MHVCMIAAAAMAAQWRKETPLSDVFSLMSGHLGLRQAVRIQRVRSGTVASGASTMLGHAPKFLTEYLGCVGSRLTFLGPGFLVVTL